MNWVFRWSFTLRFQAICRFLIQATRWARDERTCKEPRDWSMKNQLKDWKISTHLQVFVVCFDVVELRLRNYDLTEIVTGDFTDQKKTVTSMTESSHQDIQLTKLLTFARHWHFKASKSELQLSCNLAPKIWRIEPERFAPMAGCKVFLMPVEMCWLIDLWGGQRARILYQSKMKREQLHGYPEIKNFRNIKGWNWNDSRCTNSEDLLKGVLNHIVRNRELRFT